MRDCAKTPDLVLTGDIGAIDLCTGLTEVEECHDYLVELFNNSYQVEAVDAISIRHMLNPNPHTSDFLLAWAESESGKYMTAYFHTYAVNRLIYALMLYPEGNWVEALHAVLPRNDRACIALKLHERLEPASEREYCAES